MVPPDVLERSSLGRLPHSPTGELVQIHHNARLKRWVKRRREFGSPSPTNLSDVEAASNVNTKSVNADRVVEVWEFDTHRIGILDDSFLNRRMTACVQGIAKC